MRIFLDARSIVANPTGVGRYAQALIPHLARIMPRHDWCVIRHSSNMKPLGIDGVREVFVDVPADNMKNVLFGHRALEEATRKFGPPDLYHSLFHILPKKLPRSLPVVVTLHDLVWIEHADASQPTWLKARSIEQFAKRAIPAALKRADHVIAVSQFTADRASLYHRSPTTVVLHGVEERFFGAIPEPDPIVSFLKKDGCRYVVAVGNSKPYKNLERLIRAWASVRKTIGPSKLCLVGDVKALMPVVRELQLTEQDVVVVGFLNDEDLRRVVGHAHLFVFPSLVEGFGLPPLEAMALGVPVISSNIEPMLTVAGDAAITVDPLDVYAMGEAIRAIFTDDTLHAKMMAAGRTHASAMTWEGAAQKTLDVYTATLTGPL